MSRLLVGSATDVGLVRTNNQDQLLVAPGLYAVADGMGGHAAGEVASATAVTALQAAFAASDQRSAESLQNAAKAANRAVWEQARANRRMLGMGTTLVALAVVERQDGTSGLAVAHIGDSRVYLFRDGVLRQLTVDHSLVQELLDDGQISPAQAAIHPQRHVLTRALGVEPSAEVDLVEVSPQHGDRYVLCSDGLPREASDEQIAAVLRRFEDPNDAAKELVCLANSAGGSDNITVVVVDVLANEGAIDALTVPPGPAWQGASESGDRDDGRPLGGSG
ncbi:MAG TPA: Stp1/IreP family PP2C-type Ser/Thr phosphatase, partial [Acidimicrobiales bacterium]|nr:Stp1/IreP family PP2C-type Ser/Thr phosphatase [Acidimicrobiales bacterium]